MRQDIQPVVEVFLMSHNRPALLQRALQSVMRQTYGNIKVIVSDNSGYYGVVDDVVTECRADDMEVEVRYKPFCSGSSHFNQIFSEVSAEYFVVFHDDDEMLPDMIASSLRLLSKSVTRVAVGCNAYVRPRRIYSPNVMFKSRLKAALSFATVQDFVRGYLVGNICPTASFMYRKSIIGLVINDYAKGGKYSDCSFLLDVSCLGEIVLDPTPKMIVHQHAGQDSRSHGLFERIQLINYMRQVAGDGVTSQAMIQWRVRNIADKMVQHRRFRTKGYSAGRVTTIALMVKRAFGFRVLVLYSLKYIYRSIQSHVVFLTCRIR